MFLAMLVGAAALVAIRTVIAWLTAIVRYEKSTPPPNDFDPRAIPDTDGFGRPSPTIGER